MGSVSGDWPPRVERDGARITDDSTRLAVLIDADNTLPKLIKEEIVRCLKRYVARETYALLPRELLS